MGVSLKFDRQLDEVVREAEWVAATSAVDSEPTPSPTDNNGVALAWRSGEEPQQPIPSDEPLVTLLDSYRGIEEAVWNALERRGQLEGKRPPILRVGIRTLLSDSVLDKSILSIVESLVNLRNEAVHSRVRVDADDAERYALAAHEVIRVINTK